jgi:hypothetical protein
MRELLRSWFQDFLNGYAIGSSRRPEAAAMMSTDWVTFRYFIGLVIYPHVNVAVNPPPKFSDDRLNQRLDLHYLALTGPGMYLVT